MLCRQVRNNQQTVSDVLSSSSMQLPADAGRIDAALDAKATAGRTPGNARKVTQTGSVGAPAATVH
jgi:hypothetical protein